MPDYPDHTRLFHLVGTDITIPINIEASDITLPVSIDASTALVDVRIWSSAVVLYVDIIAQEVTIDVNLHAQTANIDISFADQSIAVFDASKWFAHQATQWSTYSEGSVAAGSYLSVPRVVPASKVAFILGIGCGYFAQAVSLNIYWSLSIGGSVVAVGGFTNGGAIIFDVPFRATAGQTVELRVTNWSGAAKTTGGSLWGYDEDA